MRRTNRALRSTLAALALCSSPALASTISETAKLVATGAGPNELFGLSVDVRDALAIAGAPGTSFAGPVSGAAYLFDTESGALIARLVASDGASGDYFGRAVTLADDVALVAATHDDDAGESAGAVYAFDPATGAELAKLHAGDGAAQDEFGDAIAASGKLVLIGAPGDDDNGPESGSAYLFDATTGGELHKLAPVSGLTGAHFGGAVAIDTDTAVVGAMFDGQNGLGTGAAYLFDTATGEMVADLFPVGGAHNDHFGASVAIDGAYVVVGSPWNDQQGTDSGAAYVFDAVSGAQVLQLLPNDPEDGSQFGYRVAIDGTTIVVSSYLDDDYGKNSGSAYVFDATTGQQVMKLLPSDGGPGEAFGSSVAVDGNDVIVGAVLDSEHGFAAGAAYHFENHIFSFGAGCSGTAGITPRLFMIGDPSPGAQVALVLDHGLANALSMTVIGSSDSALGIGGCTLLVAPPHVDFHIPLGGSGSYTLPGIIPPAISPGLLYIQAFVADVGSSVGFAASNGLRAEIE